MEDLGRCTARSKQSGRRCKRRASAGQATCYMHGGSSPQAQRSARQRLLELAEPAVVALAEALKSGDWPATVRAANSVLDRTGHPKSSRLEVEQVTREQGHVIARVIHAALAALGINADAPAVRAAVAEALRAESSGGSSAPVPQVRAAEPPEVYL